MTHHITSMQHCNIQSGSIAKNTSKTIAKNTIKTLCIEGQLPIVVLIFLSQMLSSSV